MYLIYLRNGCTRITYQTISILGYISDFQNFLIATPHFFTLRKKKNVVLFIKI